MNTINDKRKPLLSSNNAKTIKGESIISKSSGLPYKTLILYMSPYKANSKGKNVCSHASKGCAASCLVSSGFGGMYKSVMQGRINKTEYFLRDRLEFLFQIKQEIETALKKYKNQFEVVVRLNGTSDLPYENFKVFEGKNIFEAFPETQFYDYTKNHLRFDRNLPSNYQLTFSRSETNDMKAMELLGKGFNVAMVFDKLPETYKGYNVINGDNDDLRFLDEKNVIVGLRYKKNTGSGGGEKNLLALTSGFVINTLEARIAKTTKKYLKKVKQLV